MDTLRWADVERLADESDAVLEYERSPVGITIVWCDGGDESFAEPLDAWAAIQAMSRV